MKMKLGWAEVVLLAAPFLIIALAWNHLPAQVPTHWNLPGQVDSWSDKATGLFLTPLLAVAVTALLHILPRFDSRLRHENNHSRMNAVLPILRIALLAFLNIIFFLQVAISLGWPIAAARIFDSSVLGLLLVLGNYLGNIRPNYFVGIRTPWTLQNPETWRATHRLGGRLLFFGALVLLVGQFLCSDRLFVCLLVSMVLAYAVWGFLYSWHHACTHAATL
jgi:uncharacterized membrane protein